jgi:hypothetical protein
MIGKVILCDIPATTPATRTITPAQRLELTGLLALADAHHRDLDAIGAAARTITGDDDEYGDTFEAVHDDEGRTPHARVAVLLRRLGITEAAADRLE